MRNWRHIFSWNVFDTENFTEEFEGTTDDLYQAFSFPEQGVYPTSLEGDEDPNYGNFHLYLDNKDAISIRWNFDPSDETVHRNSIRMFVNGGRIKTWTQSYFEANGIPEWSEVARGYAKYKRWTT